MISLKKEFIILIYEKEKLLNSILDYQISNYNNSQSFCVNNFEQFFSVITKKNFDICILNLDQFDYDLKNFAETFQIKNKHTNIIAYYENNFNSFVENENKLLLLKKRRYFFDRYFLNF